MKSRFKGFVLIGLGVSLLIALFISPFASPAPNGLQKVAALKGFSEKAAGLKFWRYAPLPDYAFPWIKNEKVSTALSGLMGTLTIFFIVIGLGRLFKKR
jgi:cobalt/nickel transport protein